jgi:predicted flap endonuclease-1-like 5' DNA nuclease
MSVGQQPHQKIDWIATMTMFLIQSAILLAIAFIIGCIIGCWLRRWFGASEAAVPAVATAVSAAAIATVAAKPTVEANTPAIAIAPALQPIPAASVISAGVPSAKPAAKSSKPDDLKLIVGIGPVNERKLHGLDVTRFAQIAAWSPKDEESYGQKLEFPGRIEREEWVRQAKNLAAGGKSEDAGEMARRKGQPKPANLVGTSSKSIAPKAKPAAAKSAAPVRKPMPMKLDKPIGGKPDNLTLINGIGNVIETKLNELGVFHFEQVANWTMAQAETFSTAVGFRGRALREGWVKEAAIFAKGGTTDHAKKVESGKITTSRISTTSGKGGKK